jgi:hypothetical protein
MLEVNDHKGPTFTTPYRIGLVVVRFTDTFKQATVQTAGRQVGRQRRDFLITLHLHPPLLH